MSPFAEVTGLVSPAIRVGHDPSKNETEEDQRAAWSQIMLALSGHLFAKTRGKEVSSYFLINS